MVESKPATAAEVAAVLQQASGEKRAVRTGGAFTKDQFGGPLADAGVLLSTAALNRVIEYEPKDLTICVEAGVRYADLTRLLRDNGQMLPFDPPHASRATIGGVVAANTCGSRRRLYGTARDFVIGMNIATLDGEVVESGGRVVKNVAGLDVQKTLIGSLGTLGVITSVNFKLAPAPPATRTFILSFGDIDGVCAARDAVLQGVLQPAALNVVNANAAATFGWHGGHCLVIRAGGSAALLGRYHKELAGAEVFDGDLETLLWQGLDDFTASHPYVVRVGHPFAALSAVLESAAGPAMAHAGNGVTWLGFAEHGAVAAWFAATAGQPWSRVVESAPVAEKRGLDQWPSPGEDLELMRKLKELLDPLGLLNAGRLYGRL